MTESYSSFSTEWREEAACKGMSVNDFFPVAITKANIDSVRTLYSTCAKCPVINNCLYESITYDYDGIWAHTTHKQRKAIIRYYLNNDLDNFTFSQCKEIVAEILAARVQPNATFKKLSRKIVDPKINNSTSSNEVNNV